MNTEDQTKKDQTKLDQVKIGKVINAHGIRGDLYIGVFSEDVSWLSELKSLILETENTQKEAIQKKFSVKMKKPFKKGFICHLESIENRNLSEELKGAFVYVEKSLFVSKDGEQPYLSELLNFKVFNHDKLIGQVSAFSSNGIQDLLIVKNENEDFEIPFVKELVIEMDFNSKTIKMNLPEGLLTLNEKE